jgi:hypothetical protein
MRKIINSTFITLDGVIEGPNRWPSLGRPGDPRSGQMVIDGDVAGELQRLREAPGFLVYTFDKPLAEAA